MDSILHTLENALLSNVVTAIFPYFFEKKDIKDQKRMWQDFIDYHFTVS